MPDTRTWPGTGAVMFNQTAMSGNANGDAMLLPVKKRGADEVVVQIDIQNGEADVMIQGRLDSTAPWVDMLAAVVDEATSLTDEGLQALAYLPQMRAEVTGVASTPDVRVSLYHG